MNIKNCIECKKEESMTIRQKMCKICKRKNVLLAKIKFNNKYKPLHKDEISKYNTKYFQNNKTSINNRRVGYHLKYYKKYPEAKLVASQRNRIKKLLKNKSTNTTSLDLLNCSSKFFKAWIEWQLDDGQTMKNHGSVWHLDHCIPGNLFDLKKEKDIKRCFHWSNIQPMDGFENLSKGNTTTKIEQWLQILKINTFIKLHGNKFIHEFIILDYNRYKYI